MSDPRNNDDWMLVPTSLTLKSGHGTVMVEIPGTGGDLREYFEDLVIPVLMGAGFSRESIDKYMDGAA